MRQEVLTPTERRIECQEGAYRRLLARADRRGIFLWCKEHRRAHLVTWEEVARLQQEFRPVLLHEQVS